MSARDDIRQELEQAGSVLVRADWYDGGHLVQSGTDMVVSDMVVEDAAIGYFPAFGDRVHAHQVRSLVARGSDEWELVVDDRLRLVVSSVWLPEQRRVAREWARAPERASARAGVEELVGAIRG